MQRLLFNFAFILTFSFTLTTTTTNAQCNTNTSICSQGTAGPFGFSAPGAQVSSCLDFWGPGYAYIMLYITQSGPLEMLVNGDASSGFLDVSIFNIPQGADACTAIEDPSNEISCNYASAASGCNQIGSYFPCSSSVSSPYVNAGDKLMIVVENWSGASSNFTLELAPAPAAQTGPANPTISPVTTTVYTTSSPFQMLAADPGGTWTGPGITSNGMFDPAATGQGVFTVTYTIGSAPCSSTDTYSVVVNSGLAVEMDHVEVTCVHDQIQIDWETIKEEDCDYFRIERSRDGNTYETVGTVKGNGTTSESQNYNYMTSFDNSLPYYQLVEVDMNGTETVYGPYYTNCEGDNLEIAPNPTEDYVEITFNGFQSNNTFIDIFDQSGRKVDNIIGAANGQQKLDMTHFVSGVYTVIVRDEYHVKAAKIVKL